MRIEAPRNSPPSCAHVMSSARQVEVPQQPRIKLNAREVIVERPNLHEHSFSCPEKMGYPSRHTPIRLASQVVTVSDSVTVGSFSISPGGFSSQSLRALSERCKQRAKHEECNEQQSLKQEITKSSCFGDCRPDAKNQVSKASPFSVRCRIRSKNMTLRAFSHGKTTQCGSDSPVQPSFMHPGRVTHPVVRPSSGVLVPSVDRLCLGIMGQPDEPSVQTARATNISPIPLAQVRDSACIDDAQLICSASFHCVPGSDHSDRVSLTNSKKQQEVCVQDGSVSRLTNTTAMSPNQITRQASKPEILKAQISESTSMVGAQFASPSTLLKTSSPRHCELVSNKIHRGLLGSEKQRLAEKLCKWGNEGFVGTLHDVRIDRKSSFDIEVESAFTVAVPSQKPRNSQGSEVDIEVESAFSPSKTHIAGSDVDIAVEAAFSPGKVCTSGSEVDIEVEGAFLPGIR